MTFSGASEPAWPVAGHWLKAVLDRKEWSEAWALCDPNYRRAVAARVLEYNRRRLLLRRGQVALLADQWAIDDEPQGPTWSVFAEQAIKTFGDHLAPFGPPGAWGVSTEPRPAGLDLEIVVFLPTVPSGSFLTELPSEQVSFLMHFADNRWRILNALSAEMPALESGF